MNAKNVRLSRILLGVGGLLLIPLVAMQFTNEVNWDIFDFIVASVLLGGTGLIIEFVLRNVNSVKHKVVYCLIVLAVLFLVWAELAVGIFGTPFAGS